MQYHFLTQSNGNLKPSNKQTLEAVLKLGSDTFVRAEFKTERNPRHSAKYWALMEFGYLHLSDHFKDLQSKEELSHIIQRFLARDGHNIAGKFIQLKDEVHFERASLAFGSMSQEKFSEYYNLAINKMIIWLKAIGLELTKEELEENSEYYYNQ